MTSFVLKIIAMISMLFDHLGDAIFKGFNSFNYIGRIAFPIFAFQISEGYIHTKSVKKYLLRLIIFAIISQVPFMLFSSLFSENPGLNIFFTLALGLLSMISYDFMHKKTSKKLKSKIDKNTNKLSIGYLFLQNIVDLIPVVILCIIGEFLNVDYGWWGVLVIFSLYFFKNDKLAMTITFITLCIIKYCLQMLQGGFSYLYIGLIVCTILPITFINFYNGKQGKKIKYLLYLFYPIHLLILYFIFR